MLATYGMVVRLSVLIPLMAMTAGCDSLKNKSSEEIGKSGGAVAGAVGGNLLGQKFGKVGETVGTVGGLVIGQYIGQQFGTYLDEGSRQEMNKAAQATLKTGKVQTWSSPDGKTKGSTKVVANPVGTPKECDTVRMTAVQDDGSEREEDVTLCPDGDQYEIADQQTGTTPTVGATIDGYVDTAKEKAGAVFERITDAF